ncbi:MAG: hypothetical protein IJ776_08470 [Paludibacteraceae bacterium]|nr:hypothetical protein [Paludibacteraceae bacterium]
MNREDIEITNILTTASFEYAGKVFHGLADLQAAAYDHYHKERKTTSPFVVLVEHLYPCFDSEDYANEDRYYQNFYFTTDSVKAERICEETQAIYRFSGKPVMYPILEPRFSMGRINEHHLPYIYYHGEGDVMQIVQNRKAADEEKIHLIASR